MSTKTINIDEKLYEYLLKNSLREPELLKKLRDETALMPSGLMQISPEQGQFMGLFVMLNRNQEDSGNWSLYRLQFTRDGVGNS